MLAGSRPLGDARLAALARALGVTRVARLTGLDRTGVEVASAVRPTGHVLQVTNGKGTGWAEAVRGALAEAAELWAAERPTPGPVASAAELAERFGPAVAIVPPDALAGGAAAGEVRLPWCHAERLDGRITPAPALVPAHAVFCPPAGTRLLGPALVRWTSNGMGAHPSRAAALRHALLEAVERDQLARALPDGFTPDAVGARLLDPASLRRAAPRAAAAAEALGARGFRVHLLDCAPGPSGDRDLGLPVAAALVVDRDLGPVPVSAGYACRLGRDAALLAALQEAAQSRATEIHGAREDVLHADREAARALADLCAGIRPQRSARALPELAASSDESAVRAIAGRLARAGLGPAAVVDLPAPGLAVVKVVVPGLLVSELL